MDHGGGRSTMESTSGTAGDIPTQDARGKEASHRTSLYDRAGNIVRKIYDKRIAGPPVLDESAYFPNAALFAESWQEIRAEALAVARRLETVPRFHEILPEQAPISAQDERDWRVFILKAYGLEVAEN